MGVGISCTAMTTGYGLVISRLFCGVVYRQMIIKQLTPTILMSQAIENAKKMPPMPAKVWFFWRVTGKMLAR